MDVLPTLEKAQRQGLRVQTLEDRPALPEHLAPIVRAYRDLADDAGPTGRLRFSACSEWCRAVGASDLFWVWDRLRGMEAALHEQ